MSDMEAEVEEVSFLPGEKILNKKAVYEPSSSQRCHQLVCNRRWTIAILVTMGLFILLIAIIAAFARPGSNFCQTSAEDKTSPEEGLELPSTPSPTKDYISTDGRPFPWKDIRLPRTVLPDSYEIFLHPNISQSVFTGRVRIHSSVVTSTNFIVFHAKELNISKVSVLRGEVPVEVSDLMEYKANEQFYVRLQQNLAASSKIVIVVDFKGALINKLAGFYKSSYTTVAGEKREIATTHFEATDARTAFPCFDEPDLKANFNLSIIRERRHNTLFNMPLKTSSPYKEDLVKDEYKMSVKMSTYLVAFVVCDFKNISRQTKQGIMVQVFAPEEQIDQASYALEVAVKVLEHYTDFFGVPYPLPKQDLIAIPDFAAGAMENWGLITFRMTSILYDPQKSTAEDKQWISLVIAHELAHQWFGNIVTMKWWDDLWLNEGFAAFVEYIGAGFAEPTFGLRDQFLTATLQKGLHLDSFSNSHPIHVKVTDPAQINEIFDTISYDKGASLIAMLQGFLGEEHFKQGLHNYLTFHKYSNARTDDLWDSLQEVSNLPSTMTVKDVMDTWTLQMGYPVITVRRKPGEERLILSQSRFLLINSSHEESKYKSPYDYLWKVPLTYRTRTQDKKTVWLKKKELTLPVTLGLTDWIKFNVDTQGFYRVNYEESLWKLIIQQLKDDPTVFSVRDRAGLLDDAFALARAGQLSYSIVFELLGYLNRETEYTPLVTAISNYQYIGQRIYLTEVYTQFQKYMLDLTSPRLNSLGWFQQSNHLNKLLQVVLLNLAVTYKEKINTEKAKQLFKTMNSVPKSLRPLVYNTGVKYGDDATWKQVYEEFNSSNTPTEKKQLLTALGQTLDPRRIQLFLRDSLNEKIVRSQDTEDVISSISRGHVGLIFAWRFVQQNYDTLFKRYGRTSFILRNIFKSVITPLNTQFDYDEVTAFFKDKDLGSGSMSMKQSLEMVQSHIDWIAKNEDVITLWFQTNFKETQ